MVAVMNLLCTGDHEIVGNDGSEFRLFWTHDKEAVSSAGHPFIC